MLRYTPKQRASENTQEDAESPRRRAKTLKTKAVPAPMPDPRLVASGTPAISYFLALVMFAGLMLCAHITHSLPPPGSNLAIPGDASPQVLQASGAMHNVQARHLGDVLASSGPGCTLSEAALRGAGGRFSILAQRPDGVVLSWAGASGTAAKACPADAPLLVSAQGYQSLLNWQSAPAYRR